MLSMSDCDVHFESWLPDPVCWPAVTCYVMPCPAGSYEYIRRFIVQLSGAEGGHGPDAPSALPIYDLVAGSASGE